MTTIRDLVHALATTQPTLPRLTWYGTAGERVELSSRVLTNTVIKATNLLVAEAGAEAGVRVTLDLPVHWRSLVWALAAWTSGAEVALAGAAAPASPSPERPDASGGAAGASDAVVVSDRPPAGDPADAAGPAVVIGLALPALAMRFPGALPPGAIDGAADLMTYPDALGWTAPVDLAATALSNLGGEPPVTHGDLLVWARSVAGSQGWPASPRVLVSGQDVAVTLAAALVAWVADGSVVLVGDGGADLARIADQERVTVRL